MHRWIRASFSFWYSLTLVFCACEFSATRVDEQTIERVIIIDQSGKRWDVTQAVVRYGFAADGFKFGLGPFTVTPLILPPLLEPGEPGYPADADAFMVIGVSRAGDARAYRLDDLLDVEVVDDIIGAEPVVIVHRPLVGSSSAHTRLLDGDTLTLSASGWVYDDESVLFDYQTESMWYRLDGDGPLTCIAGTHFNAVLPAVSFAVAPWSAWRAGHPATRFMQRHPPG